MTYSGGHDFVSDSTTEILGFELLQYFSFTLLSKKLRIAFSLGFLEVGMNSNGFFLSSDLISQQFWACPAIPAELSAAGALQ